ncbi:hypothetical protein PtB15_15B158 [Puccinia triticina]|nr:hypothetical protein PtB15_15B158 [Puccinia triticina]
MVLEMLLELDRKALWSLMELNREACWSSIAKLVTRLIAKLVRVERWFQDF